MYWGNIIRNDPYWWPQHSLRYANVFITMLDTTISVFAWSNNSPLSFEKSRRFPIWIHPGIEHWILLYFQVPVTQIIVIQEIEIQTHGKYNNIFRQIQSKYAQIRKVTPVNIFCEVRRKKMASPVVFQPTSSKTENVDKILHDEMIPDKKTLNKMIDDEKTLKKILPTSEAVVKLLDGVDGVVVNQQAEVVETMGLAGCWGTLGYKCKVCRMPLEKPFLKYPENSWTFCNKVETENSYVVHTILYSVHNSAV